ncbi:hypothetical protein KY328_03890 [Candidatus Woesearchaeota archaeon]|nr:hypothetical protein [Candidatus Woesearchaeota archaeon]MBW3022038.1 hypothetical protein [Candidatus Woesearchaeota archaeon]
MAKLLDISEVKEFSFDELFARLKQVPLNPQGAIKESDGELVRPYKDSNIEILQMESASVNKKLFTPQPIVYQERLDFLNALREKFKEQGYDDPLQLTKCYDFVSHYIDDEGNEKEELWTIMPPVIEVCAYPMQCDVKGALDYSEFQKHMPAEHTINPELEQKQYSNVRLTMNFPIICDGFHRVAAALEENIPVTVLWLDNVDSRFPYYGTPRPVANLHKLQSRQDKGDNLVGKKEYVLSKPNHKALYRHFPSAGIHCGGIRPKAK